VEPIASAAEIDDTPIAPAISEPPIAPSASEPPIATTAAQTPEQEVSVAPAADLTPLPPIPAELTPAPAVATTAAPASKKQPASAGAMPGESKTGQKDLFEPPARSGKALPVDYKAPRFVPPEPKPAVSKKSKRKKK